MNLDAVFVALVACAYLSIGVFGLRSVLRDAQRRPARVRHIESVMESRHRPGRREL